MLVLDGSVTPYLPTQEILDALDLPFLDGVDRTGLARMLRERLALLHGVTFERIALFPNDEHRLDPLIATPSGGPLVVYPPTQRAGGDSELNRDVVLIDRSDRFRIEPAQIDATPPGSRVLVMTPNDPTGNAISLLAAAQLARCAKLLILDERSAEIQRRSMIPLVEEFDSIVLVRSFADWAGLGEDAPAYAITTPRLAGNLDRSERLSEAGLRAALAAVSNASKLDAIAQRVRLERLRLYRMLRKLNFIAPLPSDAVYVLATVTRGDRDAIARALFERDIAVHCPQDARLQQTLRFAAISPAATKRLQTALIDISRTELD